MTGNESTDEHLSVVITTETPFGVTHTTATDAVTPSSSGIEFYFQCAVLVIGVVGTAANALILYAMVASKQHKKNLLIFNQNTLDFFSSIFLVTTYALRLCKIKFSGLEGYWFCVLLDSEHFIWCVIFASKVNLMFVTIERYLKAVHAVWSKNKLRNWMIYAAIAFAWISGFVVDNAITYSSTDFIDGVCYVSMIWESPESQLAWIICCFLFYHVVLLSTFIFCYWRILVVIRRQAKTIASHSGPGSNTTQSRSHQIQTNVVKTMILVSAFFVITDLPLNVYYMIQNVHGNLTSFESGWYASLFICFSYYCVNPFIYATKFDPVKTILQRLIPCKKTSVQPVENVELRQSHTATRTPQPHK